MVNPVLGQLWPPPLPTPITLVSETHLNQTGTHSYSSISGLQAGDLMLLVSTGAYRVLTPPTGFTLVADPGAGAGTITSSAHAKFATGSSESFTATFTTSNAANFTSLLVFRGVNFALGRGGQANISGSTALAFTAFVFATPAGGVAITPSEAIMVVTGSAVGTTYTISPTATTTILDFSGALDRQTHLYRVPFSSSYSATPSTGESKAGVVVHLG